MNKDLSNEDKNIIANIADGNINIIRSLNNSIIDIYNDLKIFIKSCYSNEYQYNDKIIQRVNLLKRTNKVQLLIFFRIIMIYFKDLFVFSESNDIKYIVYKNLDNHYSKITSYYNQSEWNKCIDVVENTLNNIYRNASIPLCINGMLIEIQQIISEKRMKPFDINNWLEAK